MNLSHLKYFMAVARHQNISKAADECGIPQPAMSRIISKLEKDLELPLFDRYSNKIVLNKNGQRFYESVFKSLDRLDKTISEIKSNEINKQPPLKLLILQSRNMLIDMISHFNKTHPNLSFEIYHDISHAKNVEFDFYFASDSFNISEAQKYMLFSEDILLAINKDHPLAQRESSSVTLDELRNEDFISMPQTFELTNVLQRLYKKYSFEPNNVIVCDDPYYIRKYVSLGLGVSFAPAVSWKGTWGENVRFLNIINAHLSRSTWLYLSKFKDNNRDSASRIFLDYILSGFNIPSL